MGQGFFEGLCKILGLKIGGKCENCAWGFKDFTPWSKWKIGANSQGFSKVFSRLFLHFILTYREKFIKIKSKNINKNYYIKSRSGKIVQIYQGMKNSSFVPKKLRKMCFFGYSHVPRSTPIFSLFLQFVDCTGNWISRGDESYENGWKNRNYENENCFEKIPIFRLFFPMVRLFLIEKLKNSRPVFKGTQRNWIFKESWFYWVFKRVVLRPFSGLHPGHSFWKINFWE